MNSLSDFSQHLSHEAHCSACNTKSATGWSIPGVGFTCSIECAEVVLFGTDRCRWCGSTTEKLYTTVDSRLCTEDCSANYYAHVMGDRTAALGTGVRLAQWLIRKNKVGRVGLLHHSSVVERQEAKREANRLAQRARRANPGQQEIAFSAV